MTSETVVALRDRIADLRDAGVPITRAVVPADDWDAVKAHGEEVRDGDGLPKTQVAGVRVVWSDTRTEPMVEVPADAE